MKDRLALLMHSEGISAVKLAEMTHVQPSTISHIISGRNNPSYDFLAALIRHFSKLNPRWLMLGEGEMYNTPNLQCESSEIPETLIPAESSSCIDSTPPTTRHAEIEKIVLFHTDGTFTPYRNHSL